MTIEERIDEALLDLEGLLVEMSVTNALRTVAAEHSLTIDALTAQARNRFGDLDKFAIQLSKEAEEARDIEKLVHGYKLACLAGKDPHIESMLRVDPSKIVYRFSLEKCALIRERCEKIRVSAWVERGDEIDWYDPDRPTRIEQEEQN